MGEQGAELGRCFMHDTMDSQMDKKVLGSEMRIKYWIISGILANLMIVAVTGVPLVYYLGSIAAQGQAAVSQMHEATSRLDKIETWIHSQDIKDATVQAFLESKGFHTPITKDMP